MQPQRIAGQKVIVVGLGRFGGGAGVTRWLCERGASVLVTDLADEASLAPSLGCLADLNVAYRLGEHREADLDGADLLVINPAVDKARSPFIQAALSRGIAFTSEMTLFFERCRARVVAVTGSAGKSSTTAMIFDTLHAHTEQLPGAPKRVWLGGNIGGSLLTDLERIAPQDLVVLELSSFQLEDLSARFTAGGPPGVPPAVPVAVLTSLFPQHLERHGDYRTYLKVKLSLFAFQRARDHALVSADAAASLQAHGLSIRGPKVATYEPLAALEGRLRVRGVHQLYNASAAWRACRLFGLDDSAITSELCAFGGLPHRLEWVREYRGVHYYNDSKSTTPPATVAALSAFDEPVVLMVGGLDKPGDYTALAEAACRKARVVICFGQARAKIATFIRRVHADRSRPTVKSVHEFNGGVNLARRLATAGEVVLFSPGYPSYDEFNNFQQRGEQFKAIVNGWV